MTNYMVSLVGRGRRMVVVLSDIVGESPSVCGEPLSMRSIDKHTHTRTHTHTQTTYSLNYIIAYT